MIEIDKSDKLYKYLSNLKVKDIDKIYLELARNGRLNPKDIKAYLYSDFDVSDDEFDFKAETGIVLDYYNDIKKLKTLTKKALLEKLNSYQLTKDVKIRAEIINSRLKDVFYLSVCYHSNFKDLDLMDIIQVANLGLIEAIERFDSKSKLDFEDYEMFYVREKLNSAFKEKQND